ncbi:hypothetical protein GW846_02205 [Candidatus Gracilibacteria bacterium]|nr:hypothetical protein [Candidatus Gracilibacteria bacterium]
MSHTTNNGKWNTYSKRVQEEYPEINHDELHATEGWYDKMAHLLMEKYGMTHDEAMEKTKEIAEDVDYDENEVDNDKIRSFKLDTNPNHTGEMTDIL